jgi:hypothetical protein
MRLRNVLIGTVVAGAGLVAAGGIGYAAATPKVIHACKAKSGGALRAVAAGAKCRASETAISWNQQGPQGVPGKDGVSGREIVSTQNKSTATGGYMKCPAGKTPVGGGGYGYRTDTGRLLPLVASYPDSTGWRIYVDSQQPGTEIFINVFAVCAKA